MPNAPIPDGAARFFAWVIQRGEAVTRNKIATKLSPAPPPQKVLNFWTQYVSAFLSHERTDWNGFLSKLKSCTDLHWLCEPGLVDTRFQYGTVYALVELWDIAHRDQEEARWPEHLQASPSRRRRGRAEEFPAPRHLQAFLLLVQQVFARKGPSPARYRMYTAKILGHFFPDLLRPVADTKETTETKAEIIALRERQRGRALIFQRNNHGDANALARHIVNDAMGILEAYPELSR